MIINDNLFDMNTKPALKFLKKLKIDSEICLALSEDQFRKGRKTQRLQRGNLNLLEKVTVCCTSPVIFADGERLHYKLTSCQTNFIVNADILGPSELPTVAKEMKQTILGANKLSKAESVLPPDQPVVLFHHEKHPKLWGEIWKQLNATRVCAFNSGSGIIGQSILMYTGDLKALLFVSNEAQRKVLHKNVMSWLMGMSEKPDNKFSLSREQIITKLGLPEDEESDVPAPGAAKTLIPGLPVRADEGADDASQDEEAAALGKAHADASSSAGDSSDEETVASNSGDSGDEDEKQEVKTPNQKRARKGQVKEEDVMSGEAVDTPRPPRKKPRAETALPMKGLTAGDIASAKAGRPKGRGGGRRTKPAQAEEDDLDDLLFGDDAQQC